MKTLFTTFSLLLLSVISFGQIEFDKIYAAKGSDGVTQYIRIYEDGLVLMVSTKDDINKVKTYFTRDSKDTEYVILYRSQSQVKEGTKASFVLENDGNKINCIAKGEGKSMAVTMLSPTIGKQEKTFIIVE